MKVLFGKKEMYEAQSYIKTMLDKDHLVQIYTI